MDNRERGRRDASLGFGSSLQMINLIASNVVYEEPRQEVSEPITQAQQSQTGIQVSGLSAEPKWIRAVASCTMNVFEEQDRSSPSCGSIDEGTTLRLFLPTTIEQEDQWAWIQFVSGGLGDLTSGWAKVADSTKYFVEDLSV